MKLGLGSQLNKQGIINMFIVYAFSVQRNRILFFDSLALATFLCNSNLINRKL